MKRMALLVSSLLALTACSGQSDAAKGSATPTSAETQADTSASTPTETDSASTSPRSSAVPLLPDGPVEPGRYRFVVKSTCDP